MVGGDSESTSEVTRRPQWSFKIIEKTISKKLKNLKFSQNNWANLNFFQFFEKIWIFRKKCAIFPDAEKEGDDDGEDDDDDDDDDSGGDNAHDTVEDEQQSLDEGLTHNILIIFICDAMNFF